MTIRKLTVAAAIAVGIATCSFNTVMAACPCDERPVVTGRSSHGQAARVMSVL